MKGVCWLFVSWNKFYVLFDKLSANFAVNALYFNNSENCNLSTCYGTFCLRFQSRFFFYRDQIEPPIRNPAAFCAASDEEERMESPLNWLTTQGMWNISSGKMPHQHAHVITAPILFSSHSLCSLSSVSAFHKGKEANLFFHADKTCYNMEKNRRHVQDILHFPCVCVLRINNRISKVCRILSRRKLSFHW